MNLDFFFTGKLAREEAASAFIATLLKFRSDFREFFFDLIDPNLKPDIEPKVTTEYQIPDSNHTVDIFLEYPETAIIIENKIARGAIQRGQIMKYYSSFRKTQPDESIRCIVVYIVPFENTGEQEVKELPASSDFFENDLAKKISWKKLAAFLDEMKPINETEENIIRDGFETVIKKIDDSAIEKYPLDGLKSDFDTVVKSVISKLKKDFDSKISLKPWRFKNGFNIFSAGTNISLNINLEFEVESHQPYKLLGNDDPKNIDVQIKRFFSLSNVGKKDNEAREWWNHSSKVNENGYKIGEETFSLQNGGNFMSDIIYKGDINGLEERMYKLAETFLDHFCSEDIYSFLVTKKEKVTNTTSL